jgi:maternal protein exuperantia
MLKDLTTGQVLKTKSEISALQAFLAWLEAANSEASKDEEGGIILVSHEQDRQVLAPLLIQALEKYHLLPAFIKIVRGRYSIHFLSFLKKT